MKHLMMSDKSLLLGDEVADLLLTYAALVAQTRRGDQVTMNAYGIDGAEVQVGILLNSGTVLVIETTPSDLPEPDNATAVEYLRGRMTGYGDDPTVMFDAFNEPDTSSES